MAQDYFVNGTDEVELHHLYRAMAFLGEETYDQKNATPFTPRCTKDVAEERLFMANRHLYSGLDPSFSIQRPSISREPEEKRLASGASAKIIARI